MSLNKVLLYGNLGNDPEVRHLPSGQAVCEFRVATDESYVTRSGERKTDTQWHRIVVWGKQAQTCKTYLGKGSAVFVEGKIRQRSWEDKSKQKHYMTEIVAYRVQFAGARRADQPGAAGGPEDAEAPFGAGATPSWGASGGDADAHEDAAE